MAISKLELEKAIKNGESVWAYDDLLHRVIPYKANEIAITGINTNMPAYELKDLFATKQQAEHYLHHANVTRTEQLPFYTFSEIAKDEKNFKMGKTYTLIEDKNFVLDINKSYVSQIVLYTGKEKYSWNFNEENFYKAYDECVRLFKGEKK